MTGESESSTSSVESRLERLERSVAALSNEVATIRAMLAGDAARAQQMVRPTPPPLPPSRARAEAAPRPRRRFLAAGIDLERLLGRYGMLGIAVLAAAAAVGTFLSWAISRGYPTNGQSCGMACRFAA